MEVGLILNFGKRPEFIRKEYESKMLALKRLELE